MPSKDRMHELMRRVVEAALDQPKPTPQLVQALNIWLDNNEHRNRQVKASNASYVAE